MFAERKITSQQWSIKGTWESKLHLSQQSSPEFPHFQSVETQPLNFNCYEAGTPAGRKIQKPCKV